MLRMLGYVHGEDHDTLQCAHTHFSKFILLLKFIYFCLWKGPYLSFRAPPREEYIHAEAGWFTRNVLESKVLGWGLVAGVIAVPFYVGLVDALATDASAALQSYTDLSAASKFVSVSTVDALILNIAVAALIPRDLKLRQPDMEDQQARLIGASMLLLPFLGAALYCTLRPSLPPQRD